MSEPPLFPPRGRGRPRPCRPAGRGTPTHPSVGGEDVSQQPRARCLSPLYSPRVGGADFPDETFDVVCVDSPPRGRGRPLSPVTLDSRCRLTPAWAGKTEGHQVERDVVSTHPRVGGEDLLVRSPWIAGVDSPPRGRGRPRVIRSNAMLCRLTPAWAGKTSASASPGSGSATHPRLGGEDARPRRWPRACTDSPPRGRGRPRLRRPLRGVRRLTPAWAGKTRPPPCGPPVRSTHPRVGGEDHCRSSPDGGAGDSPPRGRGRRSPFGSVGVVRRLTPAWAGKTL